MKPTKVKWLNYTYPTNLPFQTIRKQSLNMFQELELSYFIRFNAIATWEWQLSQNKLCCVKVEIVVMEQLTRQQRLPFSYCTLERLPILLCPTKHHLLSVGSVSST